MNTIEFNDKSKPIYSFGISVSGEQWYAYKDGTHMEASVDEIDNLYDQWVMNPTAKRIDAGDEAVYTVKEPAMYLNE